MTEQGLDNRFPVTILTGFLGAGKTTLLNNLIKTNSNKKIAVIENEFGEIGIDNELVAQIDENIFELSNGCICCSLNDDLQNTLFKLTEVSGKIDHVIVETTGIADPGPIALTFLSHYDIQKNFRLDAIITTVDAQYIELRLEDQEEACKQIVMADLILVNKTDRVDDYTRDTVTNILKRLNPHAEIKACSFGEVVDLNLLDFKAFDVARVGMKFKEIPSTDLKMNLNPAGSNEISRKVFLPFAKKQLHTDIRSYGFVFPNPLEMFKFNILIPVLLNGRQSKIYRAKGILNFRGIKEKVVFQAVNNQFVTEKGGVWEEEKATKIVFIGKNLDASVLETALRLCYTSEDEFDPEAFYMALSELERSN